MGANTNTGSAWKSPEGAGGHGKAEGEESHSSPTGSLPLAQACGLLTGTAPRSMGQRPL